MKKVNKNTYIRANIQNGNSWKGARFQYMSTQDRTKNPEFPQDENDASF
jgi:hypothetical protein